LLNGSAKRIIVSITGGTAGFPVPELQGHFLFFGGNYDFVNSSMAGIVVKKRNLNETIINGGTIK
jgi:hypothetical protein